MIDDLTMLDIARDYIGRGYAVIPIPHKRKGPILTNWPDLRITSETASEYFDGGPQNIGVILGGASDHLGDIDLDCIEALGVADQFLPLTGSVFGRASKPRSHRLYRTPGAHTRHFKDPRTKAMLVELRANGGHQTVFPGSIHETGEPIEWDIDGAPAAIEADALRTAVARLAAACLVLRYVGNEAMEEPFENWPGLLDAVDRKLGDTTRSWLGMEKQLLKTPTAVPNGSSTASVEGFEQFEQFEQPTDPASTKRDKSFIRLALEGSYAESALADEAIAVSTAAPRGQRTKLYAAAASMGELVGAGALNEATVKDKLSSATSNWIINPEKGPWHTHQIEGVIADGIKKGTKTPRNLSKVARGIPITSEPDGAWSEPDMRLIDDDRAPPPSLEDDALPAGWGDWIRAEATARGCPQDYTAAGLIGAGSAWIGNACHVFATATWSEPPHLWFAEVGMPSSGKTPSLRPFIEATRLIERDAEPAWRDACARHDALCEEAKFVREQWSDSVRTATKQNKPPTDRPAAANAPPPLPRPRFMVMDITTEELQRLLAGQPRGLWQTRDELAGWLGNHDRYGGKGGDRAFYLEAWNGGEYVADRVKHNGDPIRIARASLAIIGGIQPDRLRDVVAGVDDGLAERLIYVYPEPAPIVPLLYHDAGATERQRLLVNAARRLCGLTPDAAPSGVPAPRKICLTPDAFDLFQEIRRDALLRSHGSRGFAAGWHGKNPGRALRVALVFELLTYAITHGDEPRTVSADSIARAGGYLDYAASMLDRVTAGLAIGQAEGDAAVIARHLVDTRAPRLNERELYQQPGWSWLRAPGRRTAAMTALTRAGWIRPTQAPGNGRRRGDWEVSPRIYEAGQ